MKGHGNLVRSRFLRLHQGSGRNACYTPWSEVYSSLQKICDDGLLIAAETLQAAILQEVATISAASQSQIIWQDPGHLMCLDTWDSASESLSRQYLEMC